MSEKKKSRYKGVHQRKNGTWYYRIKRVDDYGKPAYYQESGFKTELEAHEARILKLRRLSDSKEPFIVSPDRGIAFGELFKEFLEIGIVDSEASKKKYQALYNAQLLHLEDKNINDIEDADIDLIFLRLSLKNRKKSYIDSVRKLLNLLFKYAVFAEYAGENLLVAISKDKYKLRVLSLFSGIGAPERALTNLNVDYELINFCEIDKRAVKAYCLLHGTDPNKNLGDIVEASYQIFAPEWERFSWFTGFEPNTEEYLTIPNFDILFFGFPCQDISPSGLQKGLAGKRSGLFFKAMQIALIKKPKFVIAENVGALEKHKNFERDFARVLEEFEDCGYNFYYKTLDTQDYGIPQHRERVFMVLVREDLDVDFKFPDPIPKPDTEEWAASWFLPEVDKEYYATPEQLESLRNCESFKPNFKKTVISCITTKWGTPSHTQQTFVVDEKGTRCLSSQELMKFQGFKEEDATLLRNNGFSKSQVGKLVGNSISVPVIQAILNELISAM